MCCTPRLSHVEQHVWHMGLAVWWCGRVLPGTSHLPPNPAHTAQHLTKNFSVSPRPRSASNWIKGSFHLTLDLAQTGWNWRARDHLGRFVSLPYSCFLAPDCWILILISALASIVNTRFLKRCCRFSWMTINNGGDRKWCRLLKSTQNVWCKSLTGSQAFGKVCQLYFKIFNWGLLWPGYKYIQLFQVFAFKLLIHHYITVSGDWSPMLITSWYIVLRCRELQTDHSKVSWVMMAFLKHPTTVDQL